MDKKKIGNIVMLSVIIMITSVMLYHVISSKRTMDLAKKELIELEAGSITRKEATHVPENIPTHDPNALHPESAYLWLIPYGIVLVLLITLYIVIFIA